MERALGVEPECELYGFDMGSVAFLDFGVLPIDPVVPQEHILLIQGADIGILLDHLVLHSAQYIHVLTEAVRQYRLDVHLC